MRDNVVLTGMMGVGKTAVGRLLAERLGRPFLDLDDLVEQRSGCRIADIFATGGEAAFRRLERDAVTTLAGTRRTVIATGGWTAADTGSRAILASLGPIVCLTATPRVLAERIAASGTVSRPVLAGPGDEARLARLLDERRPVYDSLPRQVDTTRRDIPAVVAQVARLVGATADLRLESLPVRTARGGYSVLIGVGLAEALGEVLVARGLGGRVAVVTDRVVDALYGGPVARSLADAGLTVTRTVMGEGETAKTLASVADLYTAFLGAGVDRDGTVAALGGGVVGDTAGLAAATYLRGVRLLQVPTSLLAMVDAAIGGKTGVNLPAGKNLVGAFHHPWLVAADPGVLCTLSDAVRRDGLAEVVKAGLIGDPDLLTVLADGGPPPADDAASWADIVVRAAGVKAAIVAADPAEAGRRIELNLGHTFAHALEHASGHRLSHGRAVAVGLVAATRLAVRLGLAPGDLAAQVVSLLTRLGLPVQTAMAAPADVLAFMGVDKKRRDGGWRFVLARAPGRIEVVEHVPAAEVEAVLRDVCAAAGD